MIEEKRKILAKKLDHRERIIASIVLILSFLCLTLLLNGGDISFLVDFTNKFNLIFLSGALILILGKYVAEPYFTKPVDVLSNSIAIIVFLLGIEMKKEFLLYPYILGLAILLLIGSLILIIRFKGSAESKFDTVLFKIITLLGGAERLFSGLYFLILISYFSDNTKEFSILLFFWLLIVSSKSINILTKLILSFFAIINRKSANKDYIGEAIGCENPYLFTVEVENKGVKSLHKGELVVVEINSNSGYLGLIVNIRTLLNKKWLSVYLLSEGGSKLIVDTIEQNLIETDSNSIYSHTNKVYRFEEGYLKDELREIIKNNYLVRNKDNYLGYVIGGSNIHNIVFRSVFDQSNKKYEVLKEGIIVKSEIYGEESIFQIIDARTNEESLENHDSGGFLSIIAQKLGKYNVDKHELETLKWLPEMYTPVFLDEIAERTPLPLSIGCLPETDMEILIHDPNYLVTHNTAILGILGIGKSCLTFELIQKVFNNTSAKIVCIDITNEYGKKLPLYVDNNQIQNDLGDAVLKELKEGNKDGTADNPTTWGNEELYKTKLIECLDSFNTSEKRILILNPDWHSVSKAGSQFKINHKIDLSITEKTRIISERMFMLARQQYEAETTNEESKARFLLVFEEAHSLVPEWNSASNDGDQNASNGTAKVILQGRKYGLGSFVIAQRTANISKSILNQCNTIFSLRVFDDTGKQFLENYIGQDYANILPTLDIQHAVVVGKALKLKQPVVLKLNHMNEVQIQQDENSGETN
jgi:uncharacterized protein